MHNYLASQKKINDNEDKIDKKVINLLYVL